MSAIRQVGGGSSEALRPAGEEPFKLVEAVSPAIAMECATDFRLERALPEVDLRRLTEIPKPQLCQRLDVVDRRLPHEREGAGSKPRLAIL